jgi:hypothetical protein
MNPAPARITKSRGTIIKVPDANPGILLANGQQQYFTLDRVWKSPVAPSANQAVDVEFDNAGAIIAMTVVDQQQLNKERLNQLGGAAQEHGEKAAKLAKEGLGALVEKMGMVPACTAAVIWIAWFFFPAAGVAGGGVTAVTFTFWNLLGTDFNSLPSALGVGADHGLFSFLGLLAIAAPFAAPFLKTAWSRYLNAAPLGYILIAWIVIYWNENKAFGELAKIAGESPFSFSWGIFALLIAAGVLAAGALKKNPA